MDLFEAVDVTIYKDFDDCAGIINFLPQKKILKGVVVLDPPRECS